MGASFGVEVRVHIESPLGTEYKLTKPYRSSDNGERRDCGDASGSLYSVERKLLSCPHDLGVAFLL